MNNPIMYTDPSGRMPEWICWAAWGLAAATVAMTALALLIASGGSLAIAYTAAFAASLGVASNSLGLTIASYMFVGSVMAFAGTSLIAMRSGNFLEAGPNVLVSTVTSGLYGASGGYYSWNQQMKSLDGSWTTKRSNY